MRPRCSSPGGNIAINVEDETKRNAQSSICDKCIEQKFSSQEVYSLFYCLHNLQKDCSSMVIAAYKLAQAHCGIPSNSETVVWSVETMSINAAVTVNQSARLHSRCLRVLHSSEETKNLLARAKKKAKMLRLTSLIKSLKRLFGSCIVLVCMFDATYFTFCLFTNPQRRRMHKNRRDEKCWEYNTSVSSEDNARYVHGPFAESSTGTSWVRCSSSSYKRCTRP